MNTEKRQSEPSTKSENSESIQATTGLWTSAGAPPEVYGEGSITDHETKALRVTELHYRGPFRVYFNRKEEYPRIVSIDNGSHSWEICCKSVKINNLALQSKYQGMADYPSPVLVLEGFGWVQVDQNGMAVIS